MAIDEDFAAEFERKENRFKRRILEAQWNGGTIQFGRPGAVGSYSKTFDGMRKISPTISLRWEDGEPQNGDTGVCVAVIAGAEDSLIIEPEFMNMDKVMKRRAKEYKPMAEKWALWKWHTARGTPVDEYDNVLTEPGFVAPTMTWTTQEQAQAA